MIEPLLNAVALEETKKSEFYRTHGFSSVSSRIQSIPMLAKPLKNGKPSVTQRSSKSGISNEVAK